MRRIPEPELMDEPEQARAYAEADFSEPNALFIDLFREAFEDLPAAGCAVDLGCGPADITVRFARAYPGWRVDGVDGAERMLAFGRECVARAGLGERVRLVRAVLPEVALPEARYDAILSNSLLHHLHDPMGMWNTVRRTAQRGAPVLVMDLARPQTPARVDAIIRTYAADAPPVLERDFRASLRAAFRVPEVEAQVRAAGLDGLAVRMVSDRHLAVIGRCEMR